MSVKQYKLLNLLCERVGIRTAAEIKRLALYVASGVTYEEVLEHKRIYDQL